MKNKLFLTEIHPELMKLLDVSFKNACLGKTDSFLYNIDVYLSYGKNALDYYSKKARASIHKGIDNGFFKLTKDELEKLDPMYLAIFALLNENVFVGIDMKKEGYPSALYTRSLKILNQLFTAGQLEVTKEQFEKIISALVGSRTELGFREGTYLVVRLDVDSVIEDRIKFKPVIPRSRLFIGLNKDYVFIPVTFMYYAENLIKEYVKDRPFKFTKTSVIGQVSHIATISPETVRKVYEGSLPSLIESKIMKTKCGFDLTQLRFLCYDLESSLFTLGSASFRIEMLDNITILDSLDKIDKSQHNINYRHLRGIFKTKVKDFKVSQFEEFKTFDTSGFANSKDKAEAIIAWSEGVSDRDLYHIMKQYPNLFGDLDKALQIREKMASRLIKNLAPVSLPTNTEERKKVIKDMLNTGLVKMVIRSKSTNRVSERLCSNNRGVLEKLLDKDYIRKYESPSVKLAYLKKLLQANKDEDPKKLMELINSYNLSHLFNLSDFFDTSRGVRFNSDQAFKIIDKSIEELEAKNKGRSEELILFRNVEASDEKDFYKTVHVDNILYVEYAKLE